MNPILTLSGTFLLYLAAKRRIGKYSALVSKGPSAINPAKGTTPATGMPLSVAGVATSAMENIHALIKKFSPDNGG